MNHAIARIGDQEITLARFAGDELPGVYRWQVLAILRSIWPDDFRGDRQFTTTVFRPEWPSTHVVIAAGETVIAHAGFVLVDRPHAGVTYRVAGLGGVVTFQDFRGEGYGRLVVGEATRLIDQSEADVAVLFCDPLLTGFYARFGWIALPDAVTSLGSPTAPRLEHEPRMMRFLSEHGRAGREAFATIPWHLTSRW